VRALWLEPRRVVARGRTLRLANWPQELDRLRVGLMSDLHAGAPHVDERKVERLTAGMNRLRPDLVALLGDYVDPEVAFGTRVKPEAVAERLGRLEAPLGRFAVLGNHDWGDDGPRVIAALRSAGITVLENEAVTVPGRPLWIAGLADPSGRSADVDAALAAVPIQAAVIVLTHDPDLFPGLPERVALTLAGHTHGGQVDVPRMRARWTPSRFGERFAGGHVRESGRQMYVSRGVGTSRFPVRFRSPPEIVLLRLCSR
jgi:uncharacterized protein